MNKKLTALEERLAVSGYYLESMCSLSPQTTGIARVYVQLRPQPDSVHKQVSIKAKIGDAHFKSMKECGVYSVQDLELIAGTEVLNTAQRKSLSVWVEKNKAVITRYWSDRNYATDEALAELVK